MKAFFEVDRLPCRIMAKTGLVDGKIITIGGVAYLANGLTVGFVDGHEEARRYPVAFHRAAKQIVALLRGQGVRFVVGLAEDGVTAAPRWIERLGFTACQDDPGKFLLSPSPGGKSST